MAIRETQEARAVILRLGKTITTGRENPSPPDWLQVVKPEMGSAWTLKKDRTAYFYSHLVLNSLYYLSHENILSLNRDTEAVITVFEKNKSAGVPKRIYLLVIRYRDHRQSAAALDGFLCAYLPELKNKPKPIKKKENQDFVQVEDGWMGYRLLNRCLALVFGCPDRESALENMKQADLESF